MSPPHSAIEPRLTAVSNPFSDAAVGSVWNGTPVDVAEIHADVSGRLLQLVAERVLGLHHRCQMLYGDAGSGKTHVLRRLRIALENASGPVVAFAWVRMQSSPSMMWRHLRRNLADDLTRRPFRESTQMPYLLETRRGALDAIENRNLAVVLDHLAEGRFRRDAKAWISGDTLPDTVLQAMGLALTDADEEASEDESRRIVYALAKFVSPSPIVLCLDQLEALQSHPGDTNGLFAIGKLLAALHDEVPNAVVVGCVQTGLIADLAATLSKAEQDRYQPLALRPLNAAQVRALVRARLESRAEIQALRPAGMPEYWPINVMRLDPLVDSREGVSARKIIFECEQMFRAAQDLPVQEGPVEDRLSEKLEEQARGAASRLRGETTSSVLSDALPRLLHLRGLETERSGVPKWVDHLCAGPDGREIAVVLANESPRVLWRKLDRICLGWDPRFRDLVIIRDALNPIPPSAAGAIDRLHELERRGARVIAPSREALIALDAARRLLADAESGDLTYRGDRVPVATVEQWIRNHLSGAAGQVLDQVTGPVVRDTSAGLLLALAAFLSERKVASIPQVAEQLRRSPREVEDCARQNSDQFGILAGTEPAVFERIPAASGD
jgi:hypothetical protein